MHKGEIYSERCLYCCISVLVLRICRVPLSQICVFSESLSMADPKYADLPGIATDQPDTYETSSDRGQDTVRLLYNFKASEFGRIENLSNKFA